MGQPKIVATTEFKIEKSVPIPTGWGGSGSKFPLAAMEPGDSFFVVGTSRQGIHAAIDRHRRRNPTHKFTTRAEGNGYRTWRVA